MPRPSWRSAIATLGLLCVTLDATAQAAGPLERRQAAREHFKRGKEHYDAQRYADALRAFNLSYSLAPFPALLYNIALCEESLQHFEAAVETFERYQAVMPAGSEDEKVVVRHLEDLRRQLDAKVVRRRQIDEKIDGTTTTAPFVTPPPPPPPPPPEVPVYKKWWLWTIVGVAVAAGAGVGIGVGVAKSQELPTFPMVGQ